MMKKKENDMFKDIDQMLNARSVPDAPAHLTRQIIAAAARTPQSEPAVKAPSKKGFWDELKNMLAIPAPAYAFAVVLVLGVSAGVMGDVSSLLPGMTTNDLSDIMAINDSFTAGEWL